MISTTLVANFATGTFGVVDTGGIFATGVNDTGGKFAASGAPSAANISTNFLKNSKRP